MEENPYGKYVVGKDAIDVLAASPARLRELLGPLSSDVIERSPAPGKWSLREITVHMADCEIAWAFRLRQALGSDHSVQPFDQDRWAERYGAFDYATAFALFELLRNWNLRLLSTVTPEDRERRVEHPERGPIAVWTIVETIAGHDLHHLGLLERLLDPAKKQEGSRP